MYAVISTTFYHSYLFIFKISKFSYKVQLTKYLKKKKNNSRQNGFNFIVVHFFIISKFKVNNNFYGCAN